MFRHMVWVFALWPGLLLCSPNRLAAGDQDNPETQLKKLQQDYKKDYAAFIDAYRKAKTAAERTKLFRELYPNNTYAPKFLKLATAHPKGETGRKALELALRYNSNNAKAMKQLLVLLERHQSKAQGLEQTLMMMQYAVGYDPEPFLRNIMQNNPHKSMQGMAHFALARYLMRRPRGNKKEALALIEKVAKEYADVPYLRRTTLGEKAKGVLTELRNLQIGMVAPDIKGIDVDGVKFKLSDYRGKVVVIDFWGDW